MKYSVYYITQLVMVITGFSCFIALYFIPAGYGKLGDKKWGISFNNKIAWFCMEVPTLIVISILAIRLHYNNSGVRLILALFFITHYVQRTVIFPFLLKGKSTMPLSIVIMGMFFNTINSLLIGSWLFYFSPADYYTISWLSDPRFIIGTLLFFTGMTINIRSDAYIRSLRKPGDSRHYYPCKGLYRYINSANYFGELVEWIGFSILTWSSPAVLFAFWTACNLVPRSHAIYNKYKKEFPEEVKRYNPKRIIPFLY